MRADRSGPLKADAIVDQLKQIYGEFLRDAISDAALAPVLTESRFFIIRDAADQELFFATSNHLDEYLLTNVPKMVSFSEKRLLLWATEVVEFVKENFSHESFRDIFSSGLQYEASLSQLLVIDDRGRFLVKYLKEIRVDSGFVGDVLPGEFVGMVKGCAKSAIRPTLVALADSLAASVKSKNTTYRRNPPRITAVRNLPSFVDKRGTIQFSVHSGVFRISKPLETIPPKEYKPVVDRALHKLVEARTFQRIDNHDRVLAETLSEYKAHLCMPINKMSVPLLWTLGLEISHRLELQNSLQDSNERLDPEDLFQLRGLLVSHNLFLNCFDQAVSLLSDIESSAAIYQRMDATSRRLSPVLLQTIGEAENLVEGETAAAILKVAPPQTELLPPESKGTIVIRLALLRGFLHAAGHFLISGIEELVKKAAIDAGSKILIEALGKEASFSNILAFIRSQETSLLKLSEQAPIYFGYVKNLIDYFRVK